MEGFCRLAQQIDDLQNGKAAQVEQSNPSLLSSMATRYSDFKTCLESDRAEDRRVIVSFLRVMRR